MHNEILNNIEEIVSVDECFEMVVTGYSMLPLLGYGRDRIIIRRTSEDEDIIGRIVMFRLPSKHIVVHRAISVADGMVTLQGDGNVNKQEQCERTDIIGVVEKVQRSSGKIVDCTDKTWRMREKIWLSQPQFVRRYAIAIMRRWLNFKR